MSGMTYKDFLETRNRPMDTIEDALMYFAGITICGDCSKCPAHVWSGEGGCDSLRIKALEKILEAFGVNDIWERSDKDRKDFMQECLYTLLYTDRINADFFSKKKKEKKCDGTCESCNRSRMHSSGILWCDSFGNFVHDDGYCYRFEGGSDQNV